MSGGKDFDLMLSTQFALFLFSGTFVPAEAYPAGVRWLVELSPLYQSVSLIRAIAGGTLSWAQVGNVAYLVAATAVGLTIAARRMNTLLRR